jgi:hypothetical protein
MGKPIYTDEGTDYPELQQPQGQYVAEAESEFEDQEVTWPQVHARAWELQDAAEPTE